MTVGDEANMLVARVEIETAEVPLTPAIGWLTPLSGEELDATSASRSASVPSTSDFVGATSVDNLVFGDGGGCE